VGVICTVAAIVVTGGAVAQSGRTSAAVWVYAVGGVVAGRGCMQGGESVVKEERVGACLVCTSALLRSRQQVAVPFPKRFRGRGGLYLVSVHSLSQHPNLGTLS
jgi:hypothetical protein